MPICLEDAFNVFNTIYNFLIMINKKIFSEINYKDKIFYLREYSFNT